MNRELARKVADSVLYEGYMLYPYRPSAIKNRQRWCFGILYPPAYAEVISGTERSQMHSECLVKGPADAIIQIEPRFLHLSLRQIFRRIDNGLEAVPSLLIDGHFVENGDEPQERSAIFEFPLSAKRQQYEFNFPASYRDEPLCDSAGEKLGNASYSQQELRGVVLVSADQIGDDAWKVTIDVANQTPLIGRAGDRDAALPFAMLSTQVILTANNAQFISLLDLPDDMKQAAAACRNVSNFPVLLGSPGEHEMMLCSPILLYDYPQVAPESAGDFYDGTEMDEMLTLRLITLTEEEKSQMRLADQHMRSLLERTEATEREQLMRTHGTIRELRPITDELGVRPK
jgi:hypothetical protein